MNKKFFKGCLIVVGAVLSLFVALVIWIRFDTDFTPDFVAVDESKEYSIAENLKLGFDGETKIPNTSLVGTWKVSSSPENTKDCAILTIKSDGEYEFEIPEKISSSSLDNIKNNFFSDAEKGSVKKGVLKCFDQNLVCGDIEYTATSVIGFYDKKNNLEKSFVLCFFKYDDDDSYSFNLMGDAEFDEMVGYASNSTYFYLIPDSVRKIDVVYPSDEYDE